MIRRARIASTDGAFPESMRFTGLPLAMHDDSVRVHVSGDGGALPSAIDAKIALDVPELDESLRPAEDEQLEQARQQVDAHNATVRQLERELARVAKLSLDARPAGAEGEPPRPTPLDARLSLLAAREQLTDDLHQQLAAERDALRTAERHLETLQDQNRRATQARQVHEHELRKTVVISLRAPTGQVATHAEVALEYLVPGARWAPAYAIHFDNALSRAELRMRAVVAQDTGEDWRGVPLTLSTANAQAWNDLPELLSVRIGRHQPAAPKAGWRPPPTGVDELFIDYDRAFEPPAPPPSPPRGGGSVPAASHREETQPFVPTELLADDLDAVAVGAAALPMEEAPARRAAKKKKKRRRSASAVAFGGAPAGPPQSMPAPAPAPAAKTMMAGAAPPEPQMFSMRTGAFAVAAEPEPQPVSDQLRVRDDLLDYSGLRMPAPREPGRGSLIVASQVDVYVELLVAQRVHVSFDVIAAIARAQQRAHRVGELALPRYCEFAWSEHYDYAYVTDAPVDVPSDGVLHSLPVTAADTASALKHVVVPRESCDVFRLVEVENPLDAPLLPGPVDVYKDGDYLLTSRLETTSARAAVKLGLGVEQRVKVSRNTRYREDAAGLMKGALQLHHQIHIEVINHLERAIDLEVRERVPIVREDEEDIKLSVREVQPEWSEWTPFPDKAADRQLRGGYRWRDQLAAGAKKSFKAAYDVRISSKHQLVGGNRREV